MKSVATARVEVGATVDRHLWRWAQESLGSPVDAWPLVVPLGTPTEQAAMLDGAATRRWVQEWAAHSGPGSVRSSTRAWPSLGPQRIPTHLDLGSADEAAAFSRRRDAWVLARRRFEELAADWPALLGQDVGRATANRIIALDEVQWQRVRAFLRWVDAHPTSGYLPRQIPIPGVDSKWFESHRAISTSLRQTVLAAVGASSSEPVFGLRLLERELFVRPLDELLRAGIGGLPAFSATPDALSRLDIHPATVIICENLQTAHAFGPLDDVLLVARAGYAVDGFARIPWLLAARILYWGDLDTHGFAILNRVRTYAPHAESVLMDRATLLEHADLWASEREPTRATLPLLRAEEQEAYREIRDGVHGPCVRLEQERVGWAWAEHAIRRAMSVRPSY